MPALTRWSAASRIDNVRSQMGRIWQEMDQALGGLLPLPTDHVFTKGTFVPAVELYTRDRELVATVELPGFDLQDLNVAVDEHRLIVSGERKRSEAIGEEGYLHGERFYGRFSRSITLPLTVDINAVKAVLDKGVLTVHLPLAGAASAARRQITVEAR